MFTTLLLFVVLQSPTVLQSQANGFPVLGKLVPSPGMPPDFQMALIEILLENEEGRAIDRTTASPNGDFRFNRVMVGRYTMAIEGEKFQPVRQRLEIDVRTFGVVNVFIPLRPLVLSNRPADEETVSVDNLLRKLPKDAVNAYNKALEEERKGKNKEALANFQKSVKIAPEFFQAQLRLGLHYQKNGATADAIKTLEKAIELNPATAAGRTTLGRLYYDAEEYEKAAEVLDAGVKLPGIPEAAHFFLGSAQYKLGEYDTAEQTLLRLIAIAPAYSASYLQLCNVYMKNRKPAKALEQLDAYLEKFPAATDRASIQDQATKIRELLKR